MTKNPIYLLIFLIVIASAVRIYNIDSQSLWVDETITYDVVSEGSIASVIMKTAETKGWPPFFYLFVLGSVELFGKTEFAMRLPSAIFGVLSIFLIYKLASLLFTRRVGIISALLLTINPFHIFHSQNSRPYALVTALSILSIYFLVIALRKNRLYHWILYAIATVLIIYTVYFGFFLIFFENAYILYFIFLKKKGYLIKSWILGQLLILTMYLPWIFNFIDAVITPGFNTGWIAKPGPFTIFKHIIRLLIYLPNDLTASLKLFSLTLSLTNMVWILLLFAFLMIYLLAVLRVITLKSSYKHPDIVLLMGGFVIPFILMFAVSYLGNNSIFNLRYMIFILPPLLILLAYGLSKIKWSNILINFLILLFAIQVSLSLLGFHDKYFNNYGNDWRSSIGFIKDHSSQGDLILISVVDSSYVFLRSPLLFYYDGNLPSYGITYGLDIADDPPYYADMIDSIRESQRVWLVGRLNENIINFAKSLIGPHEEMFHEEFEHNSLYLYDLK